MHNRSYFYPRERRREIEEEIGIQSRLRVLRKTREWGIVKEVLLSLPSEAKSLGQAIVDGRIKAGQLKQEEK